MGLAVDLNPRYNPYIHKIGGETVVDPANGAIMLTGRVILHIR